MRLQTVRTQEATPWHLVGGRLQECPKSLRFVGSHIPEHGRSRSPRRGTASASTTVFVETGLRFSFFVFEFETRWTNSYIKNNNDENQKSKQNIKTNTTQKNINRSRNNDDNLNDNDNDIAIGHTVHGLHVRSPSPRLLHGLGLKESESCRWNSTAHSRSPRNMATILHDPVPLYF